MSSVDWDESHAKTPAHVCMNNGKDVKRSLGNSILTSALWCLGMWVWFFFLLCMLGAWGPHCLHNSDPCDGNKWVCLLGSRPHCLRMLLPGYGWSLSPCSHKDLWEDLAHGELLVRQGQKGERLFFKIRLISMIQMKCVEIWRGFKQFC